MTKEIWCSNGFNLIELNLLNTCNLKTGVLLRYVDGVFIIWDYSIDKLKEFLQDISAIDDNIKLTLKIENEKILHFLDVELTRKDGKLDRIF